MSELSELKDILSKGSDYFHSQFIASKEYKSIHENKEMVKGSTKDLQPTIMEKGRDGVLGMALTCSQIIEFK